MREELRLLLAAALPGVEVLEPHTVTDDTGRPFVIVVEGAEVPGEAWADHSAVVEVWPNVSQTSYTELDNLAATIITALSRARFSAGSEKYLVDYEGKVADAEDQTWKTITKGLRFRVYALGWLQTFTYDPDPVKAIQQWTMAAWPNVLHTNPQTWSPADVTPGVYWRMEQPVAASEPTNWGAWVDSVLACHVVAPSAAVRLLWTRRIAEALAMAPRLYMGGGLIQVQRVRADSAANPMTQGQIRLSVRYGVFGTSPIRLQVDTAHLQGAVIGKVGVAP